MEYIFNFLVDAGNMLPRDEAEFEKAQTQTNVPMSSREQRLLKASQRKYNDDTEDEDEEVENPVQV